ncbi:MAG: MBL fold metallo-hydrolase [Chthoniobacteraceae bacterium]
MSIKLTFHGAAGCVTGSAYHLQTSRASVLIDFGLFQGFSDKAASNHVPRSLEIARLDAVLLTHAHLDHCGRTPLLAKGGYRGPIFCTEPSIPLAALVLRDSAHLQQLDAERSNRKRGLEGANGQRALYTADDVEQVMRLFKPVPYDKPVEVAPGIRTRWVEAGHMLGSASIQLCIDDGGATKTLVFSGDIGGKGAPILKDAVGFQKADVVVMESTYGDRDHKPLKETVEEFESIVKATVERRGKLLVPVFAIGRTQLLLYFLALMFRNKTVPKFPVFLDSPMAIEATKIYWDNVNLFDDEFHALRRERPLMEDLDTLKATPKAEDSKALNNQAGPCLIMAGSGMSNGGRILHHLRHNLANENTSILIVGFQTEGSLGRLLVDGAKEVTMFGERIPVRAAIHTLGGFSAHAGQTELLQWLAQTAKSRPRVFLTHGEARGREPLAKLIQERLSLPVDLPTIGQSFNL